MSQYPMMCKVHETPHHKCLACQSFARGFTSHFMDWWLAIPMGGFRSARLRVEEITTMSSPPIEPSIVFVMPTKRFEVPR